MNVKLNLMLLTILSPNLNVGIHYICFIQISQKENVTVIIDDGYVLGTFDCCVCAIKEIALLTARIEEADKKYGISYQRLKELSHIASSVRFFYAI